MNWLITYARLDHIPGMSNTMNSPYSSFRWFDRGDIFSSQLIVMPIQAVGCTLLGGSPNNKSTTTATANICISIGILATTLKSLCMGLASHA